jgi:segregation and condensation protein B
MDETEIKHVMEAALLAAGKPLSLDRLAELFAARGAAPERAVLRGALDSLSADYAGRGIELKEVASGYRIQVRRSMSDWLQPLWEERAPRYTRALLETLALIAYRQPITRAEIEEVRGVVVSTNIVRTLLERNWVRVVGHRDVPGKPAMFGTTKEFLDYFGLKKLEELPTLADIKAMPELSPQGDFIETLEAGAQAVATAPVEDDGQADAIAVPPEVVDDAGDDSELDGPDLLDAAGEPTDEGKSVSDDENSIGSATVIPLRAAHSGADGSD